MSDVVVLDASAVLAALFSEPGGERVAPLLCGALISTVNLSEIYDRLILKRMAPDYVWRKLLSLEMEICPHGVQEARLAAEMLAQTRSFGLSLGDRSCLALGMTRKAVVYTAERDWLKVGLNLRIEVIRQAVP